MKKETGLFIGQTVWVKSLDRRGSGDELTETKILKIGKKYFETECTWFGRFFIDTFRHDGGQYSPRYQAYLNKEQYDNEVEARRIHSELSGIFTNLSRPTLELSKLREILSIVRS